jgi:hypothetical protein
VESSRSFTDEQKIAYHNDQQYFQMDRQSSAPLPGKRSENKKFYSVTAGSKSRAIKERLSEFLIAAASI